MGGAASANDAEEVMDEERHDSEKLVRFPRQLVEDNDVLSEGFQAIVTSKKPGDALAWWDHCGENEQACRLVVLQKRLLAGTLPGAELADANQAHGQSGSVVMMLDVEVTVECHTKTITLIVKTGDQYPAPDCDFYLQGEFYKQIPEVFLDVFAVQGEVGKGFTMVMERFGGSFPGKPGMHGYDPESMLNTQLPLVIATLAKFHAAFWNDSRIAPPYLRNSGEHEVDDGISAGQLDAFMQRRSSFVNPMELKMKGYTWLTDMALANVMKGLGEDGIGAVGAKLRFKLLRAAMPGKNWTTQVPALPPTTAMTPSFCSYEQLWALAEELRDMHGLPIGLGCGIMRPNEHRKAFFERPTKGHWTLVHNDAKFENVLLDIGPGRAKVFDFDLVGLGSGPMDLACFFVSMWKDAATATESNVKRAFELEMELALRPYFVALHAELGEGASPTLLHVADRYYGSGSVSTALIMNLLEAKGEKTFYDFLPRSICFLKRCLFYWKGVPGNTEASQTGRAALSI